ncbi:MAG: FtsB family cell division protein [Acidimicrobiales bacterium]
MLSRARLVFLVAVVLAGIIVATELPVGELLHARAAAATASVELAQVRRENKSLSEQVRDLREGASIQQIAHQQYGLVEPGQASIVVMPGSSSTGLPGSGRRAKSQRVEHTNSPLTSATIPKADLVPSDAQLSPAPVVGGRHSGSSSAGGGFWQRVLDKLEFWKATI